MCSTHLFGDRVMLGAADFAPFLDFFGGCSLSSEGSCTVTSHLRKYIIYKSLEMISKQIGRRVIQAGSEETYITMCASPILPDCTVKRDSPSLENLKIVSTLVCENENWLVNEKYHMVSYGIVRVISLTRKLCIEGFFHFRRHHQKCS